MARIKYARHAFGVCLVVTILSCLLCFGSASELTEDQEPLVFLVNAKLAPIAYEESGIAKGVVVDIARALGDKIERPIEIIAMDWVEAQVQVLMGQADALLQMNRNAARESVFSFSNPLLQSEFVIFRRKNDPHIQRAADLQGKRVGVEAGGYAYELLSRDERIEIVLVPVTLQGLESLKSGDLDALVVDRWIGEYELARSGLSGIQISREPLEVSYSHIAVRRENDQLLELINYGLQEINSDGTLERILDDWRGKSVLYVTAEQVRIIAVLTVTSVLFAISSVSIFFVVKLKRLNQDLEARVLARTQELAMVNECLEIANDELEKQSMLDQLTQIPNRRGFDAFFTRAWGMGRRCQQSLAVIAIDIDRFKSVNDDFGHLMGDQYLQELAHLLRETIRRPGDAVARLGGDEFVCVLLDTTEDGAAWVAEDIRAKIENLTITTEGGETRFSASLGVAALIPDQEQVSTSLLALADQALYKAKAGGRNRVFRASEIDVPRCL
ncbi:MAG: diguanylate cyclase [Limnochordia bacterium]|nr:diguanylate cyclase [Limnochordia bacterium]